MSKEANEPSALEIIDAEVRSCFRCGKTILSVEHKSVVGGSAHITLEPLGHVIDDVKGNSLLGFHLHFHNCENKNSGD